MRCCLSLGPRVAKAGRGEDHIANAHACAAPATCAQVHLPDQNRPGLVQLQRNHPTRRQPVRVFRIPLQSITPRECLLRVASVHAFVRNVLVVSACFRVFVRVWVCRYLEVVFVPCNKPGGMQLRMLPFAILAFMAYAVGFPLVLALILIRFRRLIMEDQVSVSSGRSGACTGARRCGGPPAMLTHAHCLCDLLLLRVCVQVLRAYDLGARKLENPNAFVLRRCLHKMYFHFKPQFWYWKICIMIRKFLIVFAGALQTFVTSARDRDIGVVKIPCVVCLQCRASMPVVLTDFLPSLPMQA
jgi:hypothetical protein